MPDFLAPLIETYDGLRVVRDDLLPGGTKRRALSVWLSRLAEGEVVYPATAQGYGQLALAHAGMDAGKKVTLFLPARSDFSKVPAVTAAMQETDAEYHFVPFPNFINVIQRQARDYAADTGAYLMPLGFAHPVFEEILTAEIAKLPIKPPREVWVTGGSGTLSRVFAKVWPRAEINVVSMGMRNFNTAARARVFRAPEKFEQRAKIMPPYPSAPHYDAKLWQFARQHARKGALVWNVGR